MSGSGTVRLFRPDPSSIEEAMRSGRAEFSYRRRSPVCAEITVVGDIDAINGRDLGGYVERHISASKQLILDLRGVDFFGCQGFTALYYISVHCGRSDVDWMLLGSRPVRRVLEVCDPCSELPLAADIETATARLNHLARHRHRHRHRTVSVG